MQKPTWVSCSRLVQQRIDEVHHLKHTIAMSKVRSSVDTRGPKLKRLVNWKKLQMQEDRSRVIDRENKHLLQRMQEIINNPQMDMGPITHKGQSNWVHRQQEMEHVMRENQLMLARLRRTKSYFNVARMEKERARMEEVIRGMSTYDEEGEIKGFWAAKAKMHDQYGLPPPRRRPKSQGAARSGGTGKRRKGAGRRRAGAVGAERPSTSDGPSRHGAGSTGRPGTRGSGRGHRATKSADGSAGGWDGPASSGAGDDMEPRRSPGPMDHSGAAASAGARVGVDGASELPPSYRCGRKMGNDRFCILTAFETLEGVRVEAYDADACETFVLEVAALGPGLGVGRDPETMQTIMRTVCERAQLVGDTREEGAEPPRLVLQT